MLAGRSAARSLSRTPTMRQAVLALASFRSTRSRGVSGMLARLLSVDVRERRIPSAGAAAGGGASVAVAVDPCSALLATAVAPSGARLVGRAPILRSTFSHTSLHLPPLARRYEASNVRVSYFHHAFLAPLRCVTHRIKYVSTNSNRWTNASSRPWTTVRAMTAGTPTAPYRSLSWVHSGLYGYRA